MTKQESVWDTIHYLQTSRLTANQKIILVYLSLMDITEFKGSNIYNELNMSKAVFNPAIHDLVKIGFIIRKSRTHYKFINPAKIF